MITSIIFSKNRACQLDLLLRSIQQNLPNFKDIFILYHSTTKEFHRGYELVRDRFPNYLYLSQTDFEQNTRSILSMINNSFERKYVCFFVDDNVIYRKSDIHGDYINLIFSTVPDLTCFTLRLGKNTVVQDEYSKQMTVFPDNIMIGNIDGTDIYVWDWTTVRVFGDFGYPFSVDGHIYKCDDILPLLKYEFDTPNAFEGRFNKHVLPTRMMGCLEQSVLVNNPINIVGSSNNNAGWWYGHTLENLNEKYLENYQISLNSIMEKEIYAAHQEMEIEFEKV